MLVLSRKLGEKIVIGHDVLVTVLEVRGDTVKLGVTAPRHISVHREEIYEEIRRANQQAAPATSGQLPSGLNLSGLKLPKPTAKPKMGLPLKNPSASLPPKPNS